MSNQVMVPVKGEMYRAMKELLDWYENPNYNFRLWKCPLCYADNHLMKADRMNEVFSEDCDTYCAWVLFTGEKCPDNICTVRSHPDKHKAAAQQRIFELRDWINRSIITE